MNKFNVGDTVKRIGESVYGIVHGATYTVERMRGSGAIVLCESSSTRGYDTDLFELVQDDGGLSDKVVFNAIVDGKPLQYRLGGGSDWYNLKYPEKLTLLDVQRGT